MVQRTTNHLYKQIRTNDPAPIPYSQILKNTRIRKSKSPILKSADFQNKKNKQTKTKFPISSS